MRCRGASAISAGRPKITCATDRQARGIGYNGARRNGALAISAKHPKDNPSNERTSTGASRASVRASESTTFLREY